jgi:hypothetical protein
MRTNLAMSKVVIFSTVGHAVIAAIDIYPLNAGNLP